MNADHFPEKRSDRGGTVICACLHRTESEIRDAVSRLELETFEAVAAALLAGTGCTTCRPEVEKILGDVAGSGDVQGPEDPAAAALENAGGEQAAASAGGRTAL